MASHDPGVIGLDLTGHTWHAALIKPGQPVTNAEVTAPDNFQDVDVAVVARFRNSRKRGSVGAGINMPGESEINKLLDELERQRPRSVLAKQHPCVIAAHPSWSMRTRLSASRLATKAGLQVLKMVLAPLCAVAWHVDSASEGRSSNALWNVLRDAIRGNAGKVAAARKEEDRLLVFNIDEEGSSAALVRLKTVKEESVCELVDVSEQAVVVPELLDGLMVHLLKHRGASSAEEDLQPVARKVWSELAVKPVVRVPTIGASQCRIVKVVIRSEAQLDALEKAQDQDGVLRTAPGNVLDELCAKDRIVSTEDGGSWPPLSRPALPFTILCEIHGDEIACEEWEKSAPQRVRFSEAEIKELQQPDAIDEGSCRLRRSIGGMPCGALLLPMGIFAEVPEGEMVKAVAKLPTEDHRLYFSTAPPWDILCTPAQRIHHRENETLLPSICISSGLLSQAPAVRSRLEALHPNWFRESGAETTNAVARGAALLGSRRSNFVVFDRFPQSIAVWAGGTWCPVVQRGQQLPLYAEVRLCTVEDFQSDMKVLCADDSLQRNVWTPSGEVVLVDLPADGLAGEIKVTLCVELDSTGAATMRVSGNWPGAKPVAAALGEPLRGLQGGEAVLLSMNEWLEGNIDKNVAERRRELAAARSRELKAMSALDFDASSDPLKEAQLEVKESQQKRRSKQPHLMASIKEGAKEVLKAAAEEAAEEAAKAEKEKNETAEQKRKEEASAAKRKAEKEKKETAEQKGKEEASAARGKEEAGAAGLATKVPEQQAEKVVATSKPWHSRTAVNALRLLRLEVIAAGVSPEKAWELLTEGVKILDGEAFASLLQSVDPHLDAEAASFGFSFAARGKDIVNYSDFVAACGLEAWLTVKGETEDSAIVRAIRRLREALFQQGVDTYEFFAALSGGEKRMPFVRVSALLRDLELGITDQDVEVLARVDYSRDRSISADGLTMILSLDELSWQEMLRSDWRKPARTDAPARMDKDEAHKRVPEVPREVAFDAGIRICRQPPFRLTSTGLAQAVALGRQGQPFVGWSAFCEDKWQGAFAS